MKPLNANSLRNALSSQATAAHPDADLLNGFAEGSLLADERRGVQDHLAGCDQCRTVVALVSDAAPPGPVEPAERRRPILRIAIPAFSAAAAVAVAFVVLHRAPREAERAAAVVQSPAASPSVNPSAGPTQTPKGVRSNEPARAPSHASETAQPSSAFSNAAATQALSEAPPNVRPHWRINPQGQPERAFGSGEWKSVLPLDAPPMRVLAVAGLDVWTGGDSLQLYHSSDEGGTWMRVALPAKDGTGHTISHIQVDSTMGVTVRASDGTTWTTSNGGASWK